MKRSIKLDWCEAGLEILETEGFDKVTIENLCGRLGVTKGSFYHHFGNTDGYVAALMEYWMERNTASIIRRTEKARDPLSKKRMLDRLVIKRSLNLEQAIRAWGYSNETVQRQVAAVDSIRLEYLAGLNTEVVKTPSEAMDMAVLEYATLIGLQQLFPHMTRKEQEHLNRFYYAKS